MPKRFIICCDGTWEISDEGDPGIPSNVTKLSRMLARGGNLGENKDIEQVVYYQDGVGTGKLDMVDRVVQGAFGYGLEQNVIKAYYFIANNYNQGDEICLFGFSRGAYTARALGWCLTQMGILLPEDLEYFPGLYKVFKAQNGNLVFSDNSPNPELRGWTSGPSDDQSVSTRQESELKSAAANKPSDFVPRTRMRSIPRPAEVKVIGVWDTVGALGFPESLFSKITGVNKQYQFYNTAVNNRVKHAFQALALDEHRGAFVPTLWYLEPGDTTDLRQCWFPGYHCDSGGGAASSRGPENLSQSDCALAWMCDQVDGMVDFAPEAASQILREIKPDVVWQSGMSKDPCTMFYSMEPMGGSHLRTPGSYYQDLKEQVPDSNLNKITRERIHPTVRLRMDATGLNYSPKALGKQTSWLFSVTPAWDYTDGVSTGNGSIWTRPAIDAKSRPIPIQEYVIRERPGMHNFETKLLPTATQELLRKRNQNLLADPNGGY